MSKTMTVLAGGMLGNGNDYYSHYHATQYGAHTPVTAADVQDELTARGYEMEVKPPPEPPRRELSRDMAIKVAVDEAIDYWNDRAEFRGFTTVRKTSTHFYRCPYSACPLEATTYDWLVSASVQLANQYLGGSALPTWAESIVYHGAVMKGLGSLGNASDWLQNNPWFLTSLGDLLRNYGAHLTSKNVEEAIKSTKPEAAHLTKDDVAVIMASLLNQGAIPPGKESEVKRGVDAAVMPSWTIPLMIGAGVLVAVMLIKR